MNDRRPRWWGALRAAVAFVAFAGPTVLIVPAWAGQGSIDHVQPATDQVNVLYSIPGVASSDPDLSSLTVSLDGQALEAEANLASNSGGAVRRTTVLAIDVSESMDRGNRIEEAKLAANAFLATAPTDLYIGIVTFAGTVDVVQEPSLDRDASEAIINALKLARGTRLYDGVRESLKAVGVEGQRNILVLSDGRDTSSTSLAAVVTDVSDSNVQTDVVALGLSADDDKLLEQIANAGEGQLLNTDDPEALTALFASEAEALSRQILIKADLPETSSSTEGTLSVTVEAAGEVYTDDAFVTVRTATPPPPAKPTKLESVPVSGFGITPTFMWAGLAAAAAGGLVILLTSFGLLSKEASSSVEDRVAAYSRTARRRRGDVGTGGTPQSSQSIGAQAIGVAQRALEGNKGLEASLGARLEAAGLQFKPAEWLLMHLGIAFATGLLVLLVTSGGILPAAIGLVSGILLPWAYLGIKRSRRVKAFKGQLADTLQLMSGSLSAGLSLAQSVDTVVREGSDPVSSEFRRALVEARLGVDIEDALEAIGERMQSQDFHWVVMAIRIQREVGGNLAELLNTVAETIREREYLHRQVQALSAEGRLSVWILGGLPPGFLLYLFIANPTYLEPMISTPLGWGLLGVMGVLITVGILWMKKLVKVDV